MQGRLQFLALLGAAAVLLAIGVMWNPTSDQDGITHAQSSCDDPFGDADVRFNPDFWEKTDFCKHNVAYGEIMSGGPPPNGIPPIYDPTFESTSSAAEWLVDRSPVIALEVDGAAKAYPLSILMWHEIVNDEIAGVPVAVTFCPLCNSSIVFDRRVDGDVLEFGTTGNLRNSDLVMWDDLTQSWWQQFTGEAIVGDYTGTFLDIIPSQVVGFGDFRTQYPEGEVLSLPGYGRSYGQNPYAYYDSEGRPLLPTAQLDAVDDRLPLTARVLATTINDVAVAYPFSELSSAFVINDTLGGEDVVAFWQPGVASALDAPTIDTARDVGTAALFSRKLDGQVLTFTADDDGTIRDEQTGSVWNAFGIAEEGELAGSELARYVANGHFWFAWSSFHPDTLLYGFDD
jgi:hypothetical protein